MNKKIFKISLYTLVILVGIFIGSSSAFAYTVLHSNGFSPIPAYVYCYSGFASSTITAVHNACNEWNTNGGQGNLVYRSTTLHDNTTYPNDNDLNQITKGERGTDKYLMQTNYVSRDFWQTTIYEADIDINVSFPFGDASLNSNLYDVQGIMTHELGHLLGLDHSAVSDATMVSGSAPGWTWKRTIEQDDKDGIAAIY